MAACVGVFACFAGRAAAHEPPSGTGVYARGAQLVIRNTRGLVASRSAERREFRWLCNEALGIAEFDAPSVVLRADSSLLVGSSQGLWLVSQDLCAIELAPALAGLRISALRADPLDSRHIYAATDRGLYESHDEGERFTQLDPHAFDSLEVPSAQEGVVFAAGRDLASNAPEAYIARWQRGRALELQAFALEANEFGVELLGSDAQRLFAAAHAYLGTQFLDRLLVSSDGAHSWHSPAAARSISAFVIDETTGVGLVGSATGLWRAADLDLAMTQIGTEAVSCLAQTSAGLYMCDGSGALGGVSASSDGGEHWRSVLRWNQVTGLPVCPADAASVKLCETAWADWQREIPLGPALAETNLIADAGPTPRGHLEGCAAVSSNAQRTTPARWQWLALALFPMRSLRRLRTK